VRLPLLLDCRAVNKRLANFFSRSIWGKGYIIGALSFTVKVLPIQGYPEGGSSSAYETAMDCCASAYSADLFSAGKSWTNEKRVVGHREELFSLCR